MSSFHAAAAPTAKIFQLSIGVAEVTQVEYNTPNGVLSVPKILRLSIILQLSIFDVANTPSEDTPLAYNTPIEYFR